MIDKTKRNTEIFKVVSKIVSKKSLKKISSGYVLILCVIIIPALLFGSKLILDTQSLLNRKATGTEYLKNSSLESQKFVKQCAQKAALEVAKKWNPALTYRQQRESMLRIADDIYNEAPTYVDSIVIQAIHGIDVPKENTNKGGRTFDPKKITKMPEKRLSPSLKQIKRTQKMTDIHRYHYWCTSYNSWQVPTAARHFYIMYNSLLRDQSIFTTEDNLYQDYSYYCANIGDPAGERWYHYVTCPVVIGMSSYDRSTPIDTKYYTIRTDLNDNTVKIECENDKIKVSTDDDIAYATPAECNVDIILTVPTNSAALNINNYDKNTLIKGTSYVSTSKTPTAEAQSTPICQIATEYRTFLKNFFYTKGVNVGVIPYSDSVFLYNNQSKWLKAAGKFVPTYFINDNQRSMIMGATILDTNKLESKGKRSIDVHSVIGDLLSKIDLSNYKIKKQELNPEQVSLLLKRSKEIDNNYWMNPYFILEMTPDIKFIYGMLGVFYPYYDDRAISNSIHIPVTWANKLFRNWGATGENCAINTALDSITMGRLSTPSKTTSDRKKALILIVNKPDWVEQEEVTYAVFNSDLSEISIASSDYKKGLATQHLDESGNKNITDNQTELSKRTTLDACTKLKSDFGANLRVYLIKFRKQTQYINAKTQEPAKFDYSYLNNCATGISSPYMYDIVTQSQLNSALSDIFTDIKDWAGRTEARIVTN